MDSLFVYRDELLNSCIASNVAFQFKSIIDLNETNLKINHSEDPTFDCDLHDDGEPCCILFELHQSHYQRSLDGIDRFQKFQNFMQSVLFIHEYNLDPKSHNVTLNQFSDLSHSELPLTDIPPHFLNGESKYRFQDIRHIDHDFLENSKNFSQQRFLGHDFLNVEHVHSFLANISTHLEEESNSKKDYEGSSRRLGQYNKTEDEIDGASQQQQNKAPEKSNHYDNKKNWSKQLNWATENNPDGVAIVHPSEDQGNCGSCWAFTATGTLEANIARRVALALFISKLQERGIRNPLMLEESERKEIDQSIRHVQKRIFNRTKLSAQELVDCDSDKNHGCDWGNPLLAYSFINEFGLVSSKDYPYIGHRSICEERNTEMPIASVESWGTLSRNDENLMEQVLQQLGPLTVGINANSAPFLMYKGGIFSDETCSQNLNHAILLVGYGEENGVKYWIARNSWGKSWGEDGFIRMKRGSGKVGEKGICGISQIPSIAIGGHLLGINFPKSMSEPSSKPFILTNDDLNRGENECFAGGSNRFEYLEILDRYMKHRFPCVVWNYIHLILIICVIIVIVSYLDYRIWRKKSKYKSNICCKSVTKKLHLEETEVLVSKESDMLLYDSVLSTNRV